MRAMMHKLHISSELALPLDAQTQTFAILAKRGVGKTYAALVLAEEFLKANLPVVVVDPVGVAWGLRSSADGKSAGLPIIIFGGEKGDVPLEVTGGAVAADLVADERMSMVLDLSLFRKGEQVRFMTDFAERLYHKNRLPVHLILDEADMFAPQRPMKGQERMLGAVEDIVRRGRARGLGVTLVTQRSAVLNKDVLTQIEVLVALRTISPQDRGAIDEWVKMHGTPEKREAFQQSLPSLPVGTAWFWSPGWLDIFKCVKIRRRDTFDSSATPEAGKKMSAPKRLAPVDIEKLRKRMASTIEKAKESDPQELRKEIARLKKELSSKTPKAAPGPEIRKVDVPVLKEKEIKRLESIVHKLEKQASIAESFTIALGDMKGAILSLIKKTHGLSAPCETGTSRLSSPQGVRQNMEKRFPPQEKSTGLHLRSGEMKILKVIASHLPVKFTRAQVGTLSGFTPSGGTFGTYFGTLRRHGFIVENGDDVEITQPGLDYLGADIPQQPRTVEEIQAQWKNALRKGAAEMLQCLIEEYPGSLAKEELAERTGFAVSGGTFGTYLGILRRNGLVEIEGDQLKASGILFEGK